MLKDFLVFNLNLWLPASCILFVNLVNTIFPYYCSSQQPTVFLHSNYISILSTYLMFYFTVPLDYKAPVRRI